MSDRDSRLKDHEADPAVEARQPWSQPTLTRMAAADAELGTRPAVPDGSFSVS